MAHTLAEAVRPTAVTAGRIVSTPPAVEPVSLNEAKLHIRIDHDNDDALITDLIASARRFMENGTHRQFITATITQYLDRFPVGDEVIRLLPPLIAVSSIQYVDTDGATQTVASTVYAVDTASEPGRVSRLPNQSWPTADSRLNAVTITHTSGYGTTAASVPEDLRAAIKMVVAHWYGPGRQAVIATPGANAVVLPIAVDSIVWNHKVMGFT